MEILLEAAADPLPDGLRFGLGINPHLRNGQMDGGIVHPIAQDPQLAGHILQLIPHVRQPRLDLQQIRHIFRLAQQLQQPLLLHFQRFHAALGGNIGQRHILGGFVVVHHIGNALDVLHETAQVLCGDSDLQAGAAAAVGGIIAAVVKFLLLHIATQRADFLVDLRQQRFQIFRFHIHTNGLDEFLLGVGNRRIRHHIRASASDAHLGRSRRFHGHFLSGRSLVCAHAAAAAAGKQGQRHHRRKGQGHPLFHILFLLFMVSYFYFTTLFKMEQGEQFLIFCYVLKEKAPTAKG